MTMRTCTENEKSGDLVETETCSNEPAYVCEYNGDVVGGLYRIQNSDCFNGHDGINKVLRIIHCEPGGRCRVVDVMDE